MMTPEDDDDDLGGCFAETIDIDDRWEQIEISKMMILEYRS